MEGVISRTLWKNSHILFNPNELYRGCVGVVIGYTICATSIVDWNDIVHVASWQMSRMSIVMVSETTSTPPQDIVIAQKALREGNRGLAHRICIQIVDNDPKDELAWLWLAGAAETLDERISALNHVLELNPDNPNARQALYETMQKLLQRDPFLGYEGETETLYQIRTASEFQFVHPKDRMAAKLFPPSRLEPKQIAYRWLAACVIGLIPAGLGTLISVPFAIHAAMKLLRESDDPVYHRQAQMVVWSAVVLLLVALLLVFLLLLHLG